MIVNVKETQVGTIHRLETTNAPVQSPARQRLQDLLNQRAAFEERAKQLRGAQQRLSSRVQEAASAAAALSEFDQRNADAMAAWARTERDGAVPDVDNSHRQELVAANALAAENAAAAQSASAQIGAEIHAEDLAAKSLTIPIEAAIAEIIAESTEPLIEDLRASVSAAITKQNRLKQALQVVIGIARSAGPLEAIKPTFNLMEKLAERLRTAAAPVVEINAADRAPWDSLVARLRTDATAELEI